MNVYMLTLGCQMNRLDAELAEQMLRQAGYTLVDSDRQADVILYVTCSVRQHAEDKIYSRLGIDAKRKGSGKQFIVGVLGCMAQREGEALAKKYSAVDFLCAPGQLYRLPELIATAADGQFIAALDPNRKESLRETDLAAMDQLDASRDPSGESSASQAFVRVMRGCNTFCSYCIVPYVRGPERSRNPEAIEEEVRRLVDAGRSEITLLGQTVNSYRYSQGDTTVRFANLLEKLSPIPNLQRLRFVTSHPIDFTDDILYAMRDLPNVCQFIHCPAQHGSNPILKAMNRGYTRADYDALLDSIYTILPEAAVVSDFIVGFPGENPADHEATIELIRRAGFKNSFVFKYSPRPGTHAAKRFKDNIPDDVKRLRNNELLAEQAKAGLKHHQQYIGKTVEVLVTGVSPRANKQDTPSPAGQTQLTARTRGDHIVIFYGPESLIDDYANITIDDANDLTLFGQLAANA